MAEPFAASQHALEDPQEHDPGDPSADAASQQGPVVTFVADLVCPWCRIAFHTLLPVVHALGYGLRWHPFLLSPGLPPQGVPRRLYLERKFGSLEAAATVLHRVARRGRGDGLRFAFDRIGRQPDTAPAHALLLAAAAAGRLEPVARALFTAFFEAGADLGDRAVLVAAGGEAGLDPAAVRAAVAPDRLALVRAEHRRAVAREIDGVPAFLVPGVGVLAGAQPAEALAAFLEIGLLTVGRSAQGRQGS